MVFPAWLRMALAASLLAAEVPAPQRGERYVSPPGLAASGDYEFRYPADLVVLQDYAYPEASVPGPEHVVVLRHRDAEAGDLRSIEINMLRSFRQRLTCVDYDVCKTVDGVVIGTNSRDPEFLKSFGRVVGSFRKR